MSNKVIVTAAVHPFLLATLEEKGFEICYEPTISHDELNLKIADAVGLIVTTRLQIDAKIIDGILTVSVSKIIEKKSSKKIDVEVN